MMYPKLEVITNRQLKYTKHVFMVRKMTKSQETNEILNRGRGRPGFFPLSVSY